MLHYLVYYPTKKLWLGRGRPMITKKAATRYITKEVAERGAMIIAKRYKQFRDYRIVEIKE